jgi:hypothetical protein
MCAWRNQFRARLGVTWIAGALIVGGCGGAATHHDQTASSETAIPTGDLRVNYGNASVVVPATWQVLEPGATICGPTAVDNVVLLGNATESGPACGPGESHVPISFTRLEALPAQYVSGTPRTINGQTAILLSPSAAPAAGPGVLSYAFPHLGIELAASGPASTSIVASIGWSSRYLVLHTEPPVGIPADWGTATYADVTVRLPRSWPLSQVGPAEGEPGCGADFSSPKLLEGPVFGHSCFGSAGESPLVDGVWLQGSAGLTAAQVAAGGFTLLRSTPVRVFINDIGDPVGLDPLLHLLVVTPDGNVDGIDVGLGPDPRVAATIIASIRLAGGSR